MTQEKPWWMESPFCDTYRVPQFDPGVGVTLNQTLHVEKIVEEATRRGKVEAWEDIRKQTEGPLISLWVNGWLRGSYGLNDDDNLNAGEVAELLEQALYQAISDLRDVSLSNSQGKV